MAILRGQTGTISFANGPAEGAGVYIQKWSATITNEHKDIASFSNNVDGAPLLMTVAQRIKGVAEGFLGRGVVDVITLAMIGTVGLMPTATDNAMLLTADTGKTFGFNGVFSNVEIGPVSAIAGENPVPCRFNFENSGSGITITWEVDT